MIYIGLFLLSFALAYIIKEVAIKKSLIAHVNERSSHTVPTPHGGGIAIVVTWFFGLLYLYLTSAVEQNLFFALLSGVLISIVSFLDDIYELSPKIRLVAQLLTAIFGLYFLGGFKELDLFIISIDFPILTNLFALILIVWYINLYNFLDGINGYAGSEAVFLAIAGYFLFGGEYFLVLTVAVLGFLYWNYNQAKIFMGDVGSTLLGYNVAIFTLYFGNQSSQNFWIWVILFSLFWFDATLTLIRRKRNGEKLSQAHKKHAYQRLTQADWSHYKVTNFSILLNILLFCIVYFVPNIFVAFFISMILLYTTVVYIDKKKAFK